MSGETCLPYGLFPPRQRSLPNKTRRGKHPLLHQSAQAYMGVSMGRRSRKSERRSQCLSSPHREGTLFNAESKSMTMTYSGLCRTSSFCSFAISSQTTQKCSAIVVSRLARLLLKLASGGNVYLPMSNSS